MIDNSFGTKNNIMHVKATDFEVFDALEMDARDQDPDLRGMAIILYCD